MLGEQQQQLDDVFRAVGVLSHYRSRAVFEILDRSADEAVVVVQGLGSDHTLTQLEAIHARARLVTQQVYPFSFGGVFHPRYQAHETAQADQARRQARMLADILDTLRKKSRICLVGYSLGGLVIAQLLVDLDGYADEPEELLARIGCVILLGSPLEARSLLRHAGKRRPAVEAMLGAYDVSAAGLYRAFPRVVQIIGEHDAIVDRARSGVVQGGGGVPYRIPPIVARGLDHASVPRDPDVLDLVERILQITLTDGFDALAETLRGERPLPWETPPAP